MVTCLTFTPYCAVLGPGRHRRISVVLGRLITHNDRLNALGRDVWLSIAARRLAATRLNASAVRQQINKSRVSQIDFTV